MCMLQKAYNLSERIGELPMVDFIALVKRAKIPFLIISCRNFGALRINIALNIWPWRAAERSLRAVCEDYKEVLTDV